jgi:glycosyltransferase involved in cell wall biosynthesis
MPPSSVLVRNISATEVGHKRSRRGGVERKGPVAVSHITPNTTEFLIVSFEGPDQYAQAGGLGVRVSQLAESLAEAGFSTRLLFVGDPDLPGEEVKVDGKLTLVRWGQWISKFHPQGVYAGEEDKVRDMNENLPAYVLEEVVGPASQRGRSVAILAEEWHTAEALCNVSDLLHWHGLRRRTVLFWNANNIFSFWRINWARLGYAATITTVSRYMKHYMWGMGLNPLVIPNGIPPRLLEPIDGGQTARLRTLLGGDIKLFKIGRFDPDKRWIMAIEAAARLKSLGYHVIFPIRGGIEPHGGDVLATARYRGLSVQDVTAQGRTIDACFAALEQAPKADVLNLRFFVPDEFVRLLYAASDAVLATSGHEPFGLVGLEGMAAGGVVFTGSSGEDYAVSSENCIAIETDDPGEIVQNLIYLKDNSPIADRMRVWAKDTAERFTWPKVLYNLFSKLEYVAARQ